MKLLREYIREEFLIEKAKQEASLFSGVSDFIESHHYDDVMDSVFRRIAPNMVRHVLEREINEDMSEFLDGAIEGRYERHADWAAEDPSPEEFGNPRDSVDYKLGYTWGWNNAATWKGNKLPGHARKEAVEVQIKEFEDQVSEQMVIAALEAANEKVNPVKLLGKAKDAIYDAVQKEGLYAGLKKGLPIAIGIIVGEALDNFIIPLAVYSLTGYPIPPLPIGVGEIINPIVISMVGAEVESEELTDELGWYEGEYGAASSLGPRAVTEMKTTKRQLRRIIREQLEGEPVTLALPSMQWVSMDLTSLPSEILDRLWSMYTTTYLNLGMDLSASNAAGLAKYKGVFLIDVDTPPDGIPDAFIVYKPTAYGNKIALLGTCQEEPCLGKRAAKSAVVKKMFDLLNSGGVFIEAGERIEQILRSSPVSPVCDEEKIKAYLGKKFVRFLDDCYYQRRLKMASAIVTKRIYGSFG